MGEEEEASSLTPPGSTTAIEETTKRRTISQGIDDKGKEEEQIENKRLKETTTTTTTTTSVAVVTDVAEHIPPGSRLAVLWEISEESTGQVLTAHWWKATLLPHDGRFVVSSSCSSSSSNNDTNINNINKNTNKAIRVLEYDALPEFGYPETSREEVIFVSSSLLIRYHQHQQQQQHNDSSSSVEAEEEEELELDYKILSDDDHDVDDNLDAMAGLDDVITTDPTTTTIVCSDLEIEDLVNDTIASALEKILPKFQQIPASRQAIVAETIAQKKEKLVTLLRQHMQTKSIVSENDMKLLLAQTMADV